MRRRAPAFALAALLGSGPAAAWADGPAAPAGSATGNTSTATVTMTPMADQGAAPAASTQPAPGADAPTPAPAPGSQATGISWSTPKHHKSSGASGPAAAGSGHRTHATASATPEGTGAVVPGFEMLGDGSTRVFVQMPKAVMYAAKARPGSVTYVLKDVHVDKRNNYNPLVTVHFNTPVTSARLVPHGKDLWLVVGLRAKVQPTAALQPAKDGGSVLQLDFPKGDYLPPTGTQPSSDSSGTDVPAPSAAKPPQP